jgi:hypothetical protein
MAYAHRTERTGWPAGFRPAQFEARIAQPWSAEVADQRGAAPAHGIMAGFGRSRAASCDLQGLHFEDVIVPRRHVQVEALRAQLGAVAHVAVGSHEIDEPRAPALQA